MHTHSTKLRPDDVLRASLKNVLWTYPCVPLCNAKGRPLPTSWGRLLPTSSGRWKMTSWRRLNVTSWGRPHIALYITPRDVPTDVLWTSHADVVRRSPYSLICNSKVRVLTMSWGRPSETSRGRPKHVFMWFYK